MFIITRCVSLRGLGIAGLADISGTVFQDLGAAMLKARSPSLSLDRGKKRSKFDADLRTVDRVDSVETGCSKV